MKSNHNISSFIRHFGGMTKISEEPTLMRQLVLESIIGQIWQDLYFHRIGIFVENTQHLSTEGQCTEHICQVFMQQIISRENYVNKTGNMLIGRMIQIQVMIDK